METLLQDLRYAARKLMRAPGFTLVAVSTLALAIGATTAVFSIVNGVLLKPLPFRRPEDVAYISSTSRDGSVNPISALDFFDYRDQSKSFVGMAGVDRETKNLTHAAAEPIRVQAAKVGARFFELLGVSAAIGRTFVSGDDRPEAPHVVVLSNQLWRSRYGSDPHIVGQTLSLDGQVYDIVGVAPASFDYPAGMDVFIPLVFVKWQLDPENRGAHFLTAVGRVKPGVTMDQANHELQSIAKRLAQTYPESNTGFGAQAMSLQSRITGKVEKPLVAMLGAVGLVLLIACANVANLLLVRASQREAEMAVRTALGAARIRIVRQLVTESLLLSLVGAVLGIAIASWGVAAVVAFGPQGLPRLHEIAIDTRVLAFALSVSVLTGVVFGLVPAFHAARSDIAQMLRESVRGTSKGGAHRTRSLLVVAEMTLAVVLLIGAGLLIHSFVRLLRVDPGFNPERVVAFNISLPDTKYQLERQVRAFTTELTDRMKQLPGTRDVGVTFGRPLDNSGMIRTTFEVDGWPKSAPADRHASELHMTSPGYFAAMGIPVVRGRLFTDADNRPPREAPAVIVVSQEFVRKYFPNEEPLGKFVKFGITHDTAEIGKGEAQVEGAIVGVVGDVKHQDLSTPNYPTTYVPFNQYAIGFMSVLVRTNADPRALQASIKKTVRDLDADVPIFGLKTMEQAVSDSVAQPRFYVVLLGVFATIALLLAALGIYGVISYSVSQRTRELGIRVALGATQRKIIALVVAQGIWMAAIGVVVGVAASLALTKAIASLMFGIGKVDPITLAIAPAVLMLAAALGCYIPARRAAGIDPVIAMRNE